MGHVGLSTTAPILMCQETTHRPLSLWHNLASRASTCSQAEHSINCCWCCRWEQDHANHDKDRASKKRAWPSIISTHGNANGKTWFMTSNQTQYTDVTPCWMNDRVPPDDHLLVFSFENTPDYGEWWAIPLQLESHSHALLELLCWELCSRTHKDTMMMG